MTFWERVELIQYTKRDERATVVLLVLSILRRGVLTWGAVEPHIWQGAPSAPIVRNVM